MLGGGTHTYRRTRGATCEGVYADDERRGRRSHATQSTCSRVEGCLREGGIAADAQGRFL